MLTPEYIESIGEELLGLYDELEKSMIDDIARRIVKTGYLTDTAQWQVLQAQHSGMLLDDIIEQIASATEYSEDEVKEIFTQAGAESIKIDSAYVSAAGGKTVTLASSGAMRRLLDENVKLINRDIGNLTGTTAVNSQQAYINATNEAYMKVTSGAFSYQEAIADAIRKTAEEGVKITFPSGRMANLDVAIRRTLVTSVNQTAGKLTETYADECGCDYYETTAHYGARPSHAEWQGQVFKIHGSDKKHRNFKEATGYGTGAGLCGWNCRHSFHLFFPGISKPAYTKKQIEAYNEKTVKYNGQSMTEYEATQEARRMERDIRESKRILSAQNAAIKASDDEVLTNALKERYEVESVRLKRKEAILRDFCRQTNRTYESARTQVHAVRDEKGRITHFDKSASQRAVQAKKRAERIRENLLGMETSDGVVIKDLSYHFAERCEERGVTMVGVQDALTKPLNITNIKVDEEGRPSLKYIGRYATVSVNPDNGAITTAWRTRSKLVKKYGGDN